MNSKLLLQEVEQSKLNYIIGLIKKAKFRTIFFHTFRTKAVRTRVSTNDSKSSNFSIQII